MNPITQVLVVEDNEDDVFFMRRALAGVATKAATQYVSDGQAALAYLRGAAPFDDRRQFPNPHLVFLDLKLPFVNGLEVLATIRHDPRLRNVRVVILTSSSEERDYRQAEQLGIEAYLVKPPTREMLQPFFASSGTTASANA